MALTRAIGVAVVCIRTVRGRMGERRLRFIGRTALAAWFAEWTCVRIAEMISNHVPVGQDVRIYYQGVQTWLHGGDPWTASVVVGPSTFSYAGAPATTVLLAPSALLSEAQFTVLWLGLTALSAVAIIRLLRLPPWWLLFPPTAEALYSGNPQLIVLMLLLVGAGRMGTLAGSLAVVLKAYAVIPLVLERRLRCAAIAIGLTIATIAVAPSLWISYAEQFGSISARLAHESAYGFSAFYRPILLVPTAIAMVLLWRRDPKAAAWLAVPALWPASEFHYSTFAQPIMTPLLAVLLAVPSFVVLPLAITLYVAWRFVSAPVHARLSGWADQATTAPSGDSSRTPGSLS